VTAEQDRLAAPEPPARDHVCGVSRTCALAPSRRAGRPSPRSCLAGRRRFRRHWRDCPGAVPAPRSPPAWPRLPTASPPPIRPGRLRATAARSCRPTRRPPPHHAVPSLFATRPEAGHSPAQPRTGPAGMAGHEIRARNEHGTPLLGNQHVHDTGAYTKLMRRRQPKKRTGWLINRASMLLPAAAKGLTSDDLRAKAGRQGAADAGGTVGGCRAVRADAEDGAAFGVQHVMMPGGQRPAADVMNSPESDGKPAAS
jgi:hypothetical protein